MAAALCTQFRPQWQPLLALGAQLRLFHDFLFASLRSVSNRMTQGQQGCPIFAFSLEEDEDQTQQGGRHEKLSATPFHCSSS
jgi:hypothetical protein